MGVVPGSVEEPNVKIFRGAASLCVLGERREAEIDFALDAVRGGGEREARSWRLVPPVQTALSFSVKSAKMSCDEDY